MWGKEPFLEWFRMIAVRESNTNNKHIGDLIGQRVGRYRIDALLGEGNMGAVYQAFDENLARKTVLKVMHRQLASHESFQQRFVQEAQAAARLDHPCIVKLYSFDTDPSLHMFMEYVEGPSLGEYLKHQQQKNESVSLDTVMRLIAQVADALDYAHERGVIHRDVKPSNVLLKPLNRPDREGDPPLRAVVTDFGLAKLLEGGMHTLTGTFMGTLSYMSPEQCLGRDLDGRSDIYSLGIVLYQVTTGQLPFNVKSPTDAIRMHVKEIPPAPRSVRPNLPEAVEQIILQSIAKNPASRFQTGSQFASALRRAAFAISNPGEAMNGKVHGTYIGSPGSIIATPAKAAKGSAEDQLLIYHAGQAPRTLNLDKDSYTVGRGQENEIVLPDKGVSRHHLTLQRGDEGWNVIDNKSTNGTFIDTMRLTPGQTEPWGHDTELRCGPYSLQWQKAKVAEPVEEVEAEIIGEPMEMQPVPVAPPANEPSFIAMDLDERPSQTSPGEIEIVVDPSNSALAAGDSLNLQVMLINRGPIVEHVNVRVEKLPQEWVTYSQELIKLMPGSRGFVRVTVHPPRSSSAGSGTHAFQVVATPMSNPDALVAAVCQMSIQAYSNFDVYLNPKPLQNTGRAEVRITNEGNADATYVISGVQQPGDILFDFAPENVKVRARPGETQIGEVEIGTLKRPLMGSAKRVPYELEVWSAGAGSKRVRAELEIRPRIPNWVLIALMTLTLATAVFLALIALIPPGNAG